MDAADYEARNLLDMPSNVADRIAAALRAKDAQIAALRIDAEEAVASVESERDGVRWAAEGLKRELATVSAEKDAQIKALQACLIRVNSSRLDDLYAGAAIEWAHRFERFWMQVENVILRSLLTNTYDLMTLTRYER